MIHVLLPPGGSAVCFPHSMLTRKQIFSSLPFPRDRPRGQNVGKNGTENKRVLEHTAAAINNYQCRGKNIGATRALIIGAHS